MKGAGLLGEMADARTVAGNTQDVILQHLVVPETNKKHIKEVCPSSRAAKWKSSQWQQFEQQNKVVLNYNAKYKINMCALHESMLIKTKRKYLSTFLSVLHLNIPQKAYYRGRCPVAEASENWALRNVLLLESSFLALNLLCIAVFLFSSLMY